MGESRAVSDGTSADDTPCALTHIADSERAWDASIFGSVPVNDVHRITAHYRSHSAAATAATSAIAAAEHHGSAGAALFRGADLPSLDADNIALDGVTSRATPAAPTSVLLQQQRTCATAAKNV